MDITPANLDFLFKGLNFAFQGGLQLGVGQSFWKEIATEMPSSTETNVYPFISMIPGLREWVGPRVLRNVAARSYSLTNKHWEDSIEVDRNKILDDQYGIYNPIAGMLGQQCAEWNDRELARVVEAGTTDLCWDGQYFFDTDHPVDYDNSGAGTNSNKLVGATYDLAGNSGDPLVAFAAARAAMMLWKREDGQQLGVVGDTIMVHPNQEKQALQVAQAINLGQVVGSGAAANSNVFSGRIKVIVNPYLTVTTGNPWYLLATNKMIKPFIWQNRQPPNLQALVNPNDPNVFHLRKFQWGVDLRGAAGYSFPFLAFRMSST